MADFYWMGGTDSLSSKFQNWSATSGGSALASWPGGSPGASDNFFFDSASAVNCTWESSVVSMATIQSIQQSLTTPYIGILSMSINLTMQGFVLNAELQGSGIITLTGTNLTALKDSASRERYILNGQFAKIDQFTGSYKITPATVEAHLDNGPYPTLLIDTRTITLAYNIPTATTHDHADDGTIHIKGASTITSGFLRIGAPDMSEDTKVKIKFDNPSFACAAQVLDFNMATALFRGITLPVTGSQVYGNSLSGFSALHYGVVIFASTEGEVCEMQNTTTLECYSLEVKAGAVFRANGQGANKPAKVNVQTQPIIKGVWAFHASNGNSFLSPKMSYISSVSTGGTGLDRVTPNALLKGNTSNAMGVLEEIQAGTNGYVLTMVGGAPNWAAAGGGGGGIGGSIAQNQIAFGAATANEIQGSGTFTFASPGSLTISTGTTDAPTINLSQNTAALTLKVLEPNDLFLSDGSNDGTGAGTRLTLVGRAFGTSSTTAGQVKLLAEHSGTNSDMLTVRTASGYLRMGPQNSGYCHFYTDRDYFYFNRPLQFDGGDGVYAYNGDFWVKTDAGNNGTPIERLTILGGTSVTTGGETRIGIANTTPTNSLHVKTAETLGDGAYAARFQMAEGNVGTTRYGGIHLDNDNNAPIDGADWSAQRWQISQRDSDHLDIAYGTPINTNVSATDTDLRITNTGNVGIGLGNTDPSAKLHVSGTIRQTASTNAVLVSNANGDIVSASNLADVPYVPIGQGGLEPYNAANPGNWLGPPPSTLEQAIQRIAQQLAALGGPIP